MDRDPSSILQSCCNRSTDGPPRRPCSIYGGLFVELLLVDFVIAPGLREDCGLCCNFDVRVDSSGIVELWGDRGLSTNCEWISQFHVDCVGIADCVRKGGEWPKIAALL